MNSQTPIQITSLPFFDASAKRVKLPQPTSTRRALYTPPTPENTFPQRRPLRTRTAQRAPSHFRTTSWDTSSSSETELLPSPPLQAGRTSTRYRQCLTPEMSRSPSPNGHSTPQPASINMPSLALRSPPLTPPTIQATLPPSTPMSHYRLRLEPLSPGEAPQAVVVFPDAATPTRALLLLGPAIARHMRERGGKATRMHPYRIVFRPAA
ncbi:hypothetical protein BDV93DRAFT_153275 [Ceratobasidium sp. AG-I]|nr:hypothetical protein BDV93DRAFT_153275 [Ceratobasidium sp. AG-I]